MSDSHDQSYYEIALTNRQVMSIFVVLLICILLSFLGGVWLGRDAGASVDWDLGGSVRLSRRAPSQDGIPTFRAR